MPVATVFENLEAGATIDDIVGWFDVEREQITAVLEFAARSLAERRPSERPSAIRKSCPSTPSAPVSSTAQLSGVVNVAR